MNMNGIQYTVKSRRFDTVQKARAYAYRVLKRDQTSVTIKQVSPYGVWYYGTMARFGDSRILYRDMYGKYIVNKDGTVREI